MFQRILREKIQRAAERYRVLGLVGPRQSGKTTLAKMAFPNHHYISLENPDMRLRATSDPKSFLMSLTGDTILDEVQNVPDLFSYLQEVVDTKKDPRKFVLTGSNSFKLNDKISQQPAESKFVIYGGDSEFKHQGCTMIPWRNIRSLQN